jgi:hypothetical protein
MEATHLGVGEKAAEKGKLRPSSAFIAGGERGGGGWRPWSRTLVTMLWWLAGPAAPWRAVVSFIPGLMGGPRSAFEPVARVGKVFRPHCSWPDPLIIVFPFSHTETNLEIIKTPFLLFQN